MRGTKQSGGGAWLGALMLVLGPPLVSADPLVTADPPGTDPPVTAAADEALMRKWTRSCALCHVDGTGGAPRLGDAGAWAPRLAQGRPRLLEHTLAGYNNMPPLGYCMACSEDDFRRLIDFMAGAAGGPQAAPPAAPAPAAEAAP